MEWPSWGWLVTGNGVASGKPNERDEVVTRKYNDVGPLAVPIDNGNRDSILAGSNPNSAGQSAGNTSDAAQRDGGFSESQQERFNRLGGAFNGRPWARPFQIGQTPALSRVPCAGSGPLNLDSNNRAYRDCSPPPGPSEADALPWITRENAKTALTELARNTPRPLPRRPGSRIPEWTATAITGVLGIGVLVSWQRKAHWSGEAVDRAKRFRPEPEREQAERKLEAWEKRAFVFAGAALVSTGITAFLWSRHQTLENFSVQPTQGGGAVSYGRSF
jgi:hypothetical protein